MRCPECGAKIREGASFCAKCGWQVNKTSASKEQKKRMIILGSAFAVMMVVLAVIVLIVGRRDGEDSDPNPDTTFIEVEQIASDESAETTDEPESADDNSPNIQFGVSAESVADYSSEQVLDYSNYVKYVSGIGIFSFSYPAALYNDVSVITDVPNKLYGTILQQVEMSSSDGGGALFEVYTDGFVGTAPILDGTYSSDITDMTNFVCNMEVSEVCAPSILVNGVSEAGDHGTVILSGYTDTTADADYVYDLCRIDDEYVYRMKLTYPKPSSGDDDRYKAYYSQMMYCLCDFSGASVNKPVSFGDFVSKRYDNFSLNDEQKSFLRGVVEYMIDSVNCGPYFGYEHDYLYGDEAEMPLGTTEEIAMELSDDKQLLQMLPYDVWTDIRVICRDDDYAVALGYNEFLAGNKELLDGALDHARVFYRDMFGLELDTSVVLNDSEDFEPCESSPVIYNSDMNELVWVDGMAGGRESFDGPDDWTYNEEMDCFDYTYGPIYDVYDDTWQDHCDRGEPGHGIYVFHVRPYLNNSLGFELLGIERKE